MKDNFVERLRKGQKAGRFWKPEVSEMIIGELVEIQAATYKGKPVTRYILKSEESGELVSVAGWTVVMSELSQANAQPGDRIGIKYLGDKGDYKDFYVLVEKQGPGDGTTEEGREHG